MRIVVVIVLVAFATGAPLSISPAKGQSRDGATQPSRTPQDAPATDCDTYAASDFDPQRKSIGVSFDKIDSALAIPACESAVQSYPNSNRLIFQLGRAYQKGDNKSSALVQYQRAADQGFSPAQYNLGLMYTTPTGVAQNYAEAMKWFSKAAEQGHVAAQGLLGDAYRSGQGVPKDYAQAAAWYLKAAEQGASAAQTALGFIYRDGQGVPQNYAEAAKWFRKAADQGNALAESSLADMYYSGLGVPKDLAEAAKWYGKAAAHGQANAQHNFGVMLRDYLGRNHIPDTGRGTQTRPGDATTR
jgi:TPR repeat protein